MTELVHYAVTRGIAAITLDSPANRNALSAQLVAQLTDRLRAADADDHVRAAVLRHTGGTFCAGADLTEQRAEGGPETGTQRMLDVLRLIVELPTPVLAGIDGHVRAGGLGLLGGCDVVVSGPRSTFAFTEVRLGLAPAIISLTTFGRMTERGAARFALTGEVFGPDEAAAAGLISSAQEDLDAALAALCDALRRCSPQGLAATKRLTSAAVRARFDAGAQAVQALSAELFASAEAREGMQAFLAKRPPRWVPDDGDGR